MPTVNVSPFGPKPQFVDAAGNPDLSYKLFFYVAGSTSTKQNTYTNSTGTVANTNPIILNALGQTPNELWFSEGLLYKVVLAPSTDTDPPTNPVWTIDNLQGINDTTSGMTVDQWQLFSSAPTYLSANSFTLVGNQTDIFHIGRRLQLTVTGGQRYGRITSSVFGANTVVTLQMDGPQVLDASLSAVYYSLLSNNVLSLPERIASTSGTNTYTATVGILNYVIGDQYKLNFLNANDSLIAPTLDLDSLGATPILLPNGAIPWTGAINGYHLIRRTSTSFILLNPNSYLPIKTRQAIQYGPTTGSPAVSDLIPQSQIGSLLAAGVTAKFSTKSTLISLANGFNADGSQRDVNVIKTTDLTLTNLTASTTNYVVYDQATDTLLKTLVTDVVQKGGTIGVTNGLYTLDYENWIVYLGNGTTASPVKAIVIAEVDTNATAVTAIRCRAYRRDYDSGWFAISAGSLSVRQHNIGTFPLYQKSWGATDSAGATNGEWLYTQVSPSNVSGGAWLQGAARNSITLHADTPVRFASSTTFADATFARIVCNGGF